LIRATRRAESRRPCEASVRSAPPTRAIEADDQRERTPTAVRADLRKRHILCVGGKVGLVPRYRALVQDANGAFSYHDGGIEDHMSRLPPMLAAADGVMCLAADVSHGAYHLIKRYCSRTGKPCALIAQSSTTAVSRCLVQIARGDASGSPDS
jgi:hypothetical protein